MTLADDRRFMARALELAERGRGLTSPNPMVGAVVVVGAEIVGAGAHLAAGTRHAEVEALDAAGARARGATLYVTLEPCAHQGRTPPCAPAVIAAGVRRVVIAVEDPDPRVSGRGVAWLRSAGIAVEVGVHAEEAARQNRVFLTAVGAGRPHVTLKVAASLDGRIADGAGESRWITGEASRQRAHRLRAESDAIVVGVGTVLRDDPRLDVRLESAWPREPYRIVLDTRARTPTTARLLKAGRPERALIAVGDDAPADAVRRLEDAGATVVRCPAASGRVELHAALAALAAREVRGVLVEGGGIVHGAFADADLVDRVAVFLAPLLLGGREAPSMVAGTGRALPDAIRLRALEVTRFGDDLLVEADVARRHLA
jgi:diaminohydroxyphosphoribosylaminopyrimidine deaminase / 5-amino-6-(5-phosphoribosylamino)uracil reductase